MSLLFLGINNYTPIPSGAVNGLGLLKRLRPYRVRADGVSSDGFGLGEVSLDWIRSNGIK
jgi:hypothetical protein